MDPHNPHARSALPATEEAFSDDPTAVARMAERFRYHEPEIDPVGDGYAWGAVILIALVALIAALIGAAYILATLALSWGMPA
jgi:hypothetical protein